MIDEDFPKPAEAEAAATDPSEAPEAPETAPEISALQRERDDYYDRLLRKTAEFENYRRRVERERREQADQAIVNMLLELLLVVDDFDRALTVDAGEGAESYRKVNDLLRKHGVRPIEALGTDFDPNVHQAVLYEESPEHREGEVVGELRRGYTIGDRLLRPAMVKVAKA
jgi:molecular chaperone GrpE